MRFDPETIADRVKAERMRRGWTVEEFAAKAGIGRWNVYKKDNKTSYWDLEDLSRVAEVFDAPTLWPILEWRLAEAIDNWIAGVK